jgi:alkaline phosphatase D
MSMWKFCLVGLSVVQGALGYFHNNLAYSSPSRRHASLAVPLHHVTKRQSGSLFNSNELNFTHGVASGDPEYDSVIIWTRLAPTSENIASDTVPAGVVPIYNDPDGAEPSDKAACVQLKVASDSTINKVVYTATAYTTSDVDYTVKVWKLDFSFILNRLTLTCCIVRSPESTASHDILLSVQRL